MSVVFDQRIVVSAAWRQTILRHGLKSCASFPRFTSAWANQAAVSAAKAKHLSQLFAAPAKSDLWGWANSSRWTKVGQRLQKVQPIQHAIDFGFEFVFVRQIGLEDFAFHAVVGRISVHNFFVGGPKQITFFVCTVKQSSELLSLSGMSSGRDWGGSGPSVPRSNSGTFQYSSALASRIIVGFAHLFESLCDAVQFMKREQRLIFESNRPAANEIMKRTFALTQRNISRRGSANG